MLRIPATVRAGAFVCLVLASGLALWTAFHRTTAEPPEATDEEDLRTIIDQATRGQGIWAVARDAPPAEPDVVARLRALGYVGAVRPAPPAANVTVYDETRTTPGLNLYVDGHAQEATLIDMRGTRLHRWSFDYARLPVMKRFPKGDLHQAYFRRAYLYPSGDLLALYDSLALIKLDKDSNLRWAYRQRPHHDLFVTNVGEIYTLTQTRRFVPGVSMRQRVVDNAIVRLDPNGQERDKVSVLEALARGGHGGLLAEALGIMDEAKGDVLHLNSIEVLDGRLANRIPAFRKGNVLVSCLTLHRLMVVDMQAHAVVWTMRGNFRFQHDAKVLPNGNLLVFDNHCGADKRSAVLELDPVTGEEVWAYRGTPEHPFYSHCCGRAYRLANGNTLIVETEGGRAFSVTREGEIVWEFVTPNRSGPNDRLIAQLFDLTRIPLGAVPWLGRLP